jgi:hypothetical protein
VSTASSRVARARGRVVALFERWPLLRAAAVYLVAFAVLAVLSGGQWKGASRDNHFVHMAQGWLHGELALPGRPPGYCDAKARAAKTCSGHRFDDWAIVTTLERADGSRVRGFPCRTHDCADARRKTRVERWWILGGGWMDFAPREITGRTETWYVSFPPGPAVVLLPAVAAFGLRTPDVLLTLLLGALIPVVLVRMLDRERTRAGGRGREHLWIAVAWTLATPAALLAANGRVWFTGQIVGALALVLYLAASWRARQPVWAAIWLGLAIACRPINHLPAVIVFGFWWWHTGRDRAALLRFAVPLLAIGLSLAWFNWVRFDDPFEFGHRFLETRWQTRIQEFGLFSARYVPRNLQCLLTLLPQWSADAPHLRASIHGTALWLGSPYLLLAPLHRQAFVGRGALWLAVLASALPSLAYQNSGQMQFSYRFAVDWLPMVLLAMAFAGAASRRRFHLLVLLGALVQGFGAWQFARAPGRLFVTDPLGWPFEAELEE